VARPTASLACEPAGGALGQRGGGLEEARDLVTALRRQRLAQLADRRYERSPGLSEQADGTRRCAHGRAGPIAAAHHVPSGLEAVD
jgi:hypothetical protein